MFWLFFVLVGGLGLFWFLRGVGSVLFTVFGLVPLFFRSLFKAGEERKELARIEQTRRDMALLIEARRLAKDIAHEAQADPTLTEREIADVEHASIVHGPLAARSLLDSYRDRAQRELEFDEDGIKYL